MTVIEYYFWIGKLAMITLVAIFFVTKLFYFYRYEHDRRVIPFLYFTKIQLKLTNSRSLRRYRKRQNLFSRIILFFLLILFFFTFLNVLIIA